MKKILHIAFSLLCFISPFFNQLLAQNDISIAPQSGTAHYTIPVWSIQENGIAHDISLTYEGKAIKSNNKAGNIGIGWHLNAGGRITRIVRGLPDDFVGGTGDARRGWLNSNAAHSLQSFSSGSDNDLTNCNDLNEAQDYSSIAGYGLHDTEPDMFHFNVGGMSGSFVFDASGTFHTVPYMDVKIEDINPSTDKLEGFIITTNDGMRYYFEEGNNGSKKVKADGSNDDKTSIFQREYELFENPVYYDFEWMLIKIASPEGHEVNFAYTTDYFLSDLKQGLTYELYYENKTISKIYSENFEIVFWVKTVNILYSTIESIEFYPETGYIKVYSGTGSARSLIKDLSIDYFYTLDDEGEKDRRFIQTITEKCIECNEQPYMFDYEGLDYNLPERFPLSTRYPVDHWGYIKRNAIEGDPMIYIYPNENGINKYRINPLPAGSGEPIILGERSFTPDTWAKQGALKKITYPSGGHTSLEYELNAYYDPGLEDSIQGGGIRIKKITANDGLDPNKNIVKRFYYKEEDNQTSGKLINNPVFTVPKAREFVDGYEAIKQELDAGDITLKEFWETLTYVSDHNLQIFPAKTPNVLYSRVQTKIDGEGSTIDEFDQSPDFYESNSQSYNGTFSKVAREKINSGTLAGRCVHPGIIENGYSYFPYAPSPNYEYLQGLPKKTSIFDESGYIRKSVEYYFDQISLNNDDPFVIKAMKFDKVEGRYRKVSGDGTYPPAGEFYIFGNYQINTDIISAVSSVVEKTYNTDNSGNYLSSEKSFLYESPLHLNLTAQKFTNSDATTHTTTYKYPLDYGETNPFTGDNMVVMLNSLKYRFMHGVVVESVQKVQEQGQSEFVIGGQLRLFDSFNGIPKPSKIYNLTISDDLSFIASGIAKEKFSENRYFYFDDDRYRLEQSIEEYDIKGNVITITGLQRTSNAVHMGHNHTLPIINIANAKAGEVAFSDFTNTATGHAFSGTGTIISTGRTGDNGYQLGQTQYIQQNVVQKKQGADNYIFSCWIRASVAGVMTVELRNSSNVLQTSGTMSYKAFPDQWRYYEVKLPVSNIGDQIRVKASASSSTIVDDDYDGISIDDVALYPADADVNYFSYKPLVGKTSETNSRGKSTFYVYDSDQRLKLTKDEKGNILQRNKSDFASLNLNGYGLYQKTEAVLAEGITTEAALDALDHTGKSSEYNYYDGFGRLLQQVSQKATPSSNDLIQFYNYVSPGTPAKSYLPYAATQNSGAFRSNPLAEQAAFYASGNDIATDDHPYAVTVTDQSPLQSVVKQGGTGTDWQPGTGHEIQSSHRVNNLSDAVRLWKANGTSTTTYATGSLFVQEMIDENGNSRKSFIDKLGRMVLNRVTAEAGADPYLDTYYIYDEFSRLKFTASPEAVAIMKASGSWSATDNAVAELCFRNTYDDYGRLSEAKVPGKGASYYVYDNTDRLLLAQDGNQRLNNKWIYQKYGSRGNSILQGSYTDNTRTSLSAMQTYVQSFDYDGPNVYYEKPHSSADGYSNNTFPQSNTEIYKVTYYDDYDFDRNGSTDSQANFLNDGLYTFNVSVTYPRLAVTGEKKRIIGVTDQWLWSYHRYDEYNRVIQSRSNNQLNVTVADLQTNLYDFSGKLLKSKVTTTVNGQSTIVNQEYTYDHAGRLQKIYHKVDTQDPVLIVNNKYNELGQLIDKKLHATNTAETTYLQSVDYRYNIRGLLTSINNAALNQDLLTNDDDDDYFGMEIGYNNSIGTGNLPQYNGNISAIKWSANLGLDDEKERVYNYSYDKTDRIKAAAYKNKTTAWNMAGGAFGVNNIQYDRNGNLKTITRKEADGSDLDALTYNYGTGAAKSNRLLGVTDSGNLVEGFKEGNTSGNDYEYDINGNVIKDLNKGISAISYNFLNRPETITKPDGSIKYSYDATGIKLSQEVYNGSNELIKRIDYIGGIVYENQELQFIQHPEGRVMMTDHQGLGIFPEYQYYIRDHLDNVRTTFTSKPKTREYLATVESGAAIVAQESADFDNYDDAVIVTNGTANHTDGGTRAIRLNATNTQIIGLAKSLKVYPGDKITMEVQAKFIKELAGANQTNVSALIGHAFMNAFGIVNSGETQQTYQFFSDFFSAGPVFSAPYDDGVPNAYLNYLLFDKDYNLMDAGFDPLTSAAQQPMNTSVITPHELLELVANVTKEGYIYIYLSNENDMVNEVFLDDLKITHVESPVIQVADYYPFGLQHSTSWTRNNSVKNNRLFNAGSEFNEITDNYETYYRNYDPALGRFMAIDPMASSFTSWSPYNYAYNDPVYYNDPKGDCPDCTDFLSDILYKYALHADGSGSYGSNNGGGLGGGSIATNYGRGGNSFSGWAPNATFALSNLRMSAFGGTWSNGRISYFPSNRQARNSGYWIDPPTTSSGDEQEGTLKIMAKRSYWVTFGQPAQNGGDKYDGSDMLREGIIGVTGAALAEWGSATVPKPGGVGGGGKSGAWTSRASKTLRATKWGAKKLPVRILGAKTLGAVAGRFVPYVGWGLLAYDVVDFSVNFPWVEAFEIVDNNQTQLDQIYGPGVISIMPKGPK